MLNLLPAHKHSLQNSLQLTQYIIRKQADLRQVAPFCLPKGHIALVLLNHGAKAQGCTVLDKAAVGQNIFADHGVTLVRHGARANLAHAEALLQLADFRPLKVNELVGNFANSARKHCYARGKFSKAVSRYVPSCQRHAQTQVVAKALLHRQALLANGCQRSCCPRQLAYQISLFALLQPLQMAAKLCSPNSNFITKSDGYSMLSMRTAGHHHISVFLRTLQAQTEQHLGLLHYNLVRVTQLQHHRCIHNILRSSSPVNPTTCLVAAHAFKLADLRHQRVAGLGKALTDSVHIHAFAFGAAGDMLCRLLRHNAQSGLGLCQSSPTVQPVLH